RLAGPVQPDRKRLKVGPLPLHGFDVVGATPQIGQPSVVLLLGVINIAQPAVAHHEDVGDGLVPQLIEDNLAQRLTVVRRALLAVAVEVDEVVVLIGVWDFSDWHGFTSIFLSSIFLSSIFLSSIFLSPHSDRKMEDRKMGSFSRFIRRSSAS